MIFIRSLFQLKGVPKSGAFWGRQGASALPWAEDPVSEELGRETSGASAGAYTKSPLHPTTPEGYAWQTRLNGGRIPRGRKGTPSDGGAGESYGLYNRVPSQLSGQGRFTVSNAIRGLDRVNLREGLTCILVSGASLRVIPGGRLQGDLL